MEELMQLTDGKGGLTGLSTQAVVSMAYLSCSQTIRETATMI